VILVSCGGRQQQVSIGDHDPAGITDDGATGRDECGRVNDDHRRAAHGGAVAVCSAHRDRSSNKKAVCNKGSVNKAVPPAATTEADFVKGREIPFFGEQLLSYADDGTAARALDKYQSNASACTTYEDDGFKVDIGQLLGWCSRRRTGSVPWRSSCGLRSP
jgi:hypothetical protein